MVAEVTGKGKFTPVYVDREGNRVLIALINYLFKTPEEAKQTGKESVLLQTLGLNFKGETFQVPSEGKGFRAARSELKLTNTPVFIISGPLFEEAERRAKEEQKSQLKVVQGGG